MDSSSNNLFKRWFGQKQSTDAPDPPQCAPQSSSGSTNAPSTHGLAGSLELKHRGSEASSPDEDKSRSPSEQEKVNSNDGAEDQLTEMVGRNERDNEYDREKEDCGRIEFGSICRSIHPAHTNIKTAEMNAQEREGLKNKSGQTEIQAAKLKVEDKDESKENLLQDQCRAAEIILEEKEEYAKKPRQNEVKGQGVDPRLKGKEKSEEMPRQTEHKPTKAKVKKESGDVPGQTECEAGKLSEKEESLNIGKARCKAVKVNMKEKDDSKEEAGKSEIKVTKKRVRKKVESKVEPTQTTLKGSFLGLETERGSNREVENGRSEGGGKQVEEEKEGREREGEKTEVQSENTIPNETDKGDNEKKKVTPSGPDKHINYPVRPDAEECAHYMQTGICKFGSNCKFNHPVQKKVKKKIQAAKQKEMEESKEESKQTTTKVKNEAVPKENSGQTQSKAIKEKVKEKTESIGNTKQINCKLYSSPEGCKFGKGCKFSHKKSISVPLPVGHNFMGLPLRSGVKDCSNFMQYATCKSDVNCKFNHPNPTPVIDNEPSVQDSHGECTSSQSTQSFPSPNESTTSVYNAEWSPFELPQPPSPAFIMQSPTSEKCMYTSQEQWVMEDKEDPDHLGQPDFRSTKNVFP